MSGEPASRAVDLEALRRLAEGADGGRSPRDRAVAAPAPAGPEARAALQQALRLLSGRAYAVDELRRRLRRQHEAAAVEAALARLSGTPFLDDAAWAASYVSGAKGRVRSSTLLRRELASKGVTTEDARRALEAHDDAEAALRAARKRIGALRRLEPAVRVRRLRDYLLRRGFSGAVTQRALTTVLEADAECLGEEAGG